jgi:hypothetical protein
MQPEEFGLRDEKQCVWPAQLKPSRDPERLTTLGTSRGHPRQDPVGLVWDDEDAGRRWTG